MEKITLYSSKVYLSEENSNPDSYIAKFVICDFGRNKNGVSIDRDSIGQWLTTLKNKPLVGKIKMHYDGTCDFSSHNMKKIKKIDENGNEYYEVEFNTDAFGTFFDVGIETINDIEYIVASCEIWKRFTKACEIIISRVQEGNLHTSWEISIEKSKQGIVDGLMTKIIEVGRFMGHCLLAKDVPPAYDSSGLLEIASSNYDVEFAEALSHDIISQGLDIDNQEKEENILKKDENIALSEDEVINEPVLTEESICKKKKTDVTVNDTDSEEDKKDKKKKEDEEDLLCKKKKTCSTSNPDVSSLTSYDLRNKISKACRDKCDKWCYVVYFFPEEHEVWCACDGESELDYLKFTYVVENDEVIVSEPEDVVLTVSLKDVNSTIAEYEGTIEGKDDLIVKASSEITSLKSENAELSKYKEKFTEMEQKRIDNELSEQKKSLIASVVKSGQITEKEIELSEELSSYVENLDKKSLMAIVGERLSASVDEKHEAIVDPSEKKTETIVSNLNNEDDETIDSASIMRNFLKK